MCNNIICFFILGFIITCNAGCNKLVQIPEPVNTITTSEVFSTSAEARSAIAGIYSDMSWANGNLNYANGAITIFCGMSADELNNFGGPTSFETNTLLADDGSVNSIWSGIYYDIYLANAAISGLQNSKNIPSDTRSTLIAEAKFIRAFCYFHLINLFGDVPLTTSPDWTAVSLMARTPVSKVYDQIESDLKDAQNSLPADYSVSNGERIMANKWAATALLARVYLYNSDWNDALTQATEVINQNNIYSLSSDLNATFLKNNNEAIWQLQLADNTPWATLEGNFFNPNDSLSSPNFSLTPQLLSAFEIGDQRRAAWVDSTDFSGQFYYYPYKYKVKIGTSGDLPEYYTLLRLAEQYLIRAEAEAQLNKLAEAMSDIDTIRSRAGLLPLPQNLNQTQVIAAVAQERRIEFFAEWGHRWLDLKRTGQADAVLTPIKPDWKTTAKLFPIPAVEIKTDPNLKQNEGYQ